MGKYILGVITLLLSFYRYHFMLDINEENRMKTNNRFFIIAFFITFMISMTVTAGEDDLVRTSQIKHGHSGVYGFGSELEWQGMTLHIIKATDDNGRTLDQAMAFIYTFDNVGNQLYLVCQGDIQKALPPWSQPVHRSLPNRQSVSMECDYSSGGYFMEPSTPIRNVAFIIQVSAWHINELNIVGQRVVCPEPTGDEECVDPLVANAFFGIQAERLVEPQIPIEGDCPAAEFSSDSCDNPYLSVMVSIKAELD